MADFVDLPLFEASHRTLHARVREFASNQIAPRAAAAEQGNPVEHGRRFVRLAADAGLLGIFVPAGSPRSTGRPDLRSLCLARDAIASASGFADSVYAVQGLGTYPIWLAGSDALQRRYLEPAASGSLVAAFALTEPEAGSDPGGIQATARRDTDGWVIDGTKTLISNAGLADFYVVFAQADPSAGRKGLAAFVVDATAPGLRVVRTIDLLAPHPIGEIEFDGCRVPSENRLGSGGDGLKIALATLDFFRASVGAAACGMAARALDETVTYAKRRRQFGQSISDFQLTRAALADMSVDLDAARLLVYRAAWKKDAGAERITREASAAKLFATEAAQRIIDRAVQLHGGNGVVRGSAVERLYREIRALRIYEGTSEIQRLVIAEQLLGRPEV